MFRPMRRKAQQLSRAECERLLAECTHGVLALSGDDGYPYAVPLSYVYHDGSIFFHCAPAGHKPDAIARCGKASFCVVAQDDIVPEKYTTLFRSVIVFGKVSVITGDDKAAAIRELALRYAPLGTEESIQREISASPGLTMLRLNIEHMTGKEARELMTQRE